MATQVYLKFNMCKTESHNLLPVLSIPVNFISPIQSTTKCCNITISQLSYLLSPTIIILSFCHSFLSDLSYPTVLYMVVRKLLEG